VACAIAGLLAAALSVLSLVTAGPARSATLLGYDMSADARGLQLFTVIPDSQLQPELDIPQASSTLTSGQGYGLASAAWPGPVVANGGSLLGLLVPGFPAQVAGLLLYPVRAEARTGQDPSTTVYDVPGLTMRSRAETDVVESEAGAQGVSVLPGSFGVSRATTSTRATESAAKATARSVIQNVDIGGVLKIDQVVSTATATSDGLLATGSASTVVSGATVNGSPVTIDDTGLHFTSTSQPVDAVTNQINQQLLEKAGIHVAVGPATKELSGPSATMAASSVIVTMTQNGVTLGYAMGGARVSTVGSADEGGDAAIVDTGADLAGAVPDAAQAEAPAQQSTTDSGALEPAPSAGGDVAAPVAEPAPTSVPGRPSVDLTPTLAVASGRSVPALAVLLAIGAALLFAAGLRRLGSVVLTDAAAATHCTLPGEDR
jgi:hypothetical protein